MADGSQRSWSNSMAEAYETLLVPALFQPYAAEVAKRIAGCAPENILELAAGSGVVTRELEARIPNANVIATDLNPGMVDLGRQLAPQAHWRQADALDLPFGDAEFDLVLCQFGAMFFSDKRAGFAETRRVLSDGGTFHCALWASVPENDFADATVAALQQVFPDDPPDFLTTTPYAYNDPEAIAGDVRAAGFNSVHLESVALQSTAPSAEAVAKGFCQGTPLFPQLQERDGVDAAIRAVEKEVTDRFGGGPVTANMTAVLVQAS